MQNNRDANKFVLLKLFCQENNAKPTSEVTMVNQSKSQAVHSAILPCTDRYSRLSKNTEARDDRAARIYHETHHYAERNNTSHIILFARLGGRPDEVVYFQFLSSSGGATTTY